MNKIKFTMENYERCKCPTCPVQAQNKCIMKEKSEIPPKIKEEIDKETLPGMYCAKGEATCTVLDTKQICQCYSCPLWTEYDLLHGKPMKYFCRDVAAK
ncbi:MAG: DUF2769 domain-containing protein [Methanobacterium sp.]